MAKNNENALSVSTDLKLDTSIGADEIVAIRVAAVERQLLAKQEFLKRRRSSLKAEEVDAQKHKESVMQGVAMAWLEGKVGKLQAALKAAGLTSKAAVYTCVVRSDDDKGCEKHVVSAEIDVVRSPLELELSASRAKPITDAQRKLDEIRDELCEVEDQIVRVKLDMQKLPTLERQVRAKVAEEIILAGTGGPALLKSIQGVTVPGLTFED